MRVFVALDIPDEVRSGLRDLIGKLEPVCRGARWVRAEGVHITLKFIGEAPPEKVEGIRTELRSVRAAEGVKMSFRNVGFFPNAKRPRVCWVGIEASANLAELAARIESGMEKLGIPREQRAFKPHLTLARFKSEEGLPQLRDALVRLGPVDLGGARTAEFHLYQSKLKPGGAEYSKLETFRFTEPGE